MIIDIQYVFLALSVIAVLLIAFIAYQISELSYKFARMSDLTLDELAKTSSQISRLEVWLERISLDMEYIATKAREEE
jgi:predicted PurR-regulated permease PerM